MLKIVIVKAFGSSRLFLSLLSILIALTALVYSFTVRTLTTQEVALVTTITTSSMAYVAAETKRPSEN